MIMRRKYLRFPRFEPDYDYESGEIVKVVIPGPFGNNVYTVQANQAIEPGLFDAQKWTNLTPKFHPIADESQLMGFAMPGDTVLFNAQTVNPAKLSAIGTLFERETEIPFVGTGIPTIESGTEKFVVNFSDFYIDAATIPERYYSMPSKKSGIEGVLKLIKLNVGATAQIKCVTKTPVTNYAPDNPVGLTNHLFGMDRNGYTWGTISTPDIGTSGDEVIEYNLSNAQDDFQWFEISNNAGVIDVVKHPINTNI